MRQVGRGGREGEGKTTDMAGEKGRGGRERARLLAWLVGR